MDIKLLKISLNSFYRTFIVDFESRNRMLVGRYSTFCVKFPDYRFQISVMKDKRGYRLSAFALLFKSSWSAGSWYFTRLPNTGCLGREISAQTWQEVIEKSINRFFQSRFQSGSHLFREWQDNGNIPIEFMNLPRTMETIPLKDELVNNWLSYEDRPQ